MRLVRNTCNALMFGQLKDLTGGVESRRHIQVS